MDTLQVIALAWFLWQKLPVAPDKGVCTSLREFEGVGRSEAVSLEANTLLSTPAMSKVICWQ
jgi:hypothetical protein